MVEYGTRHANYPAQPFIRPSVVALPQALLRVSNAVKAYTKKFISQPGI